MNLSSVVMRKVASFQVGVCCPYRFYSEISLSESNVYGCHSSGSSSNHCSHYHQTRNYISQNLLPCRVCGIRVCLREEILEGRSEAEVISLRQQPKSWSDVAASVSHTIVPLVWTYAGLLRPLSLPSPCLPAISSV